MGIDKNFAMGLLALLSAVMTASTPTVAQQPQKPNVVFILADNVGYGDLGPYGGGELRGAPTPRIDQLAREGLRLTQFLVEPACTPSRAALMTGRYSIREGLSLILVPDGPNTLSARAVTMGDLFKSAGYATAIFGKWHLGKAPQSLPTAHGFDEYYGIPPDMTWDSATYVDKIELTHSLSAPRDVLVARGPQIVEATAGGELHNVKPFTPEVRANIDNELVQKSIDFMRRQKAAGKPFFLYLPFSMGHIPNLPSSAERAKKARKEADRLACDAWTKRMLGYKGPAQPSPTIGDALNAGYRYLEVRCLGCDTNQTVALDIIRRPKTTPVHELERYMRCKDCSKLRGYPYKRSCLVALRGTKISAVNPPSVWWPGER